MPNSWKNKEKYKKCRYLSLILSFYRRWRISLGQTYWLSLLRHMQGLSDQQWNKGRAIKKEGSLQIKKKFSSSFKILSDTWRPSSLEYFIIYKYQLAHQLRNCWNICINQMRSRNLPIVRATMRPILWLFQTGYSMPFGNWRSNKSSKIRNTFIDWISNSFTITLITSKTSTKFTIVACLTRLTNH